MNAMATILTILTIFSIYCRADAFLIKKKKWSSAFLIYLSIVGIK
jgi:hypothetical protein